MKKNKLLFIILLLPFSAFCQSLTGLWNGTFSNDSNTLRTDQPFEIALTEYKGKVYGYSRREFIKNDTLYFVLKRVKGKIAGDSCEVTEDEFISHNLPVIDKGVKITYTFHFNKNDSSWSLDGRWKTNRVVKRKYEYYALTGKVGMIVQKDLSKSKLFPHLTELKLEDDVPFYAAYKKQKNIEEEQKNIAVSKNQSEKKQADIVKAEPKKKEVVPAKKEPEPETTQPVSKPDITKASTENNKPKEKEQPKQETVVIPPKDVAKTNTTPEKKKEDITVKKTEPAVPTPKPDVAKTNTDNNKPKEKEQPKQEPVVIPSKEVAKTNTEPEKKKEDITVKKENPVIAPDIAAAKPKDKPGLPKSTAAVNVEKRKSETIQTVEFKSDSLLLSLYDNGEIDGDTVSVLINGEVVMPQQGLKASAIKKTIYITPAMKDSFNMVLYAENLGKYPPNTGLIIVHDGDDTYQVRFSADLQKNVEVLFKRKKK